MNGCWPWPLRIGRAEVKSNHICLWQAAQAIHKPTAVLGCQRADPLHILVIRNMLRLLCINLLDLICIQLCKLRSKRI